jgi:hypothetical protein
MIGLRITSVERSEGTTVLVGELGG